MLEGLERTRNEETTISFTAVTFSIWTPNYTLQPKRPGEQVLLPVLVIGN